MKKDIEKQIKYYKQLNLSWNIDRMLKINKAGISIKDLFSIDNEDAVISFVLFGLDNIDVIRANNILTGWIELFNNYNTLRLLIISDLKEVHKFIYDKEIEDDDLVSIWDKPVETEEPKELSHEEILKQEKNNLEYIIKVYMRAGYKYEEALQKDLCDFEFLNNYVLEERERKLNDYVGLIHRLGAWCGIAVNNPKNYPASIEPIRLRPLTREEKIEQLRLGTEQMYNNFKMGGTDNE